MFSEANFGDNNARKTHCGRMHGFFGGQIIAILAAILFPVFARAREKARQTSCASNLKQMCLAAQMYTQDYDETFIYWAIAWPGIYNTVWWWQGVAPYVKNDQLIACPSADGDPTKNCACGGVQAPRPIQYGVACGNGGQNGTQMPNWTSPLGQKLAVIQRPSECVWIADSGCVNIGPNNLYPDQGATCPGVAGRHNGGANFGFVDGHVKWYTWATTTSLPFSAWSRN